MFQANAVQDLEFYCEASLRITSSLDMAEAMKATFDYLCWHFPLEGISLHQLDPELKGHKLFFLVTKSGFHYVERFLPLEDADVREMLRLEKESAVYNVPNEPMRPVSFRHSRILNDILPFKQRAYLVDMLRVGESLLGHLVFLGNAPNCFTPEHERKLALLVPHFSVAMANMLQFHRTLMFQQRLDDRKNELEAELRQLRGQGMVGASNGLKHVMDMVSSLNDSEAPVLIQGETGTGKEMLADAIQRISPRKEAPFVRVNCGAIPETLVDSELFGYQKGAFTGATTARSGRFEQAHGGTLFLDEVGELPLQVQVRLLRVLQNQVVERLGGNTPIPVNIRIIAATNRNLEQMLRNGTFREDLYYRLNVFPIRIPPLRERTGDIPALTMHFLEKLCARMKRKDIPRIRPSVFERLQAYTWPGNVRELENLVERALILCTGAYIDLESFLPQDPAWYVGADQTAAQDSFQEMIAAMVARELEKRLNEASPSATSGNSCSFKSLDNAAAEHIRSALTRTGGRIHGPYGAGALLSVNPNTLRKKMRKLGIDRADYL